jgi:hypothetical protein
MWSMEAKKACESFSDLLLVFHDFRLFLLILYDPLSSKPYLHASFKILLGS